MDNLKQKAVIKPTLSKPGRIAVTACAYSSDGNLLAGGLMDGTIQLWSASGSKIGVSAAVGVVPVPKAQMQEKQTWNYLANAKYSVKNAHEPQNEITSLTLSQVI